MSLVPYLTDSPAPEMDCAPMIALGIAFAIATNLLHRAESDEEICNSTQQPIESLPKQMVDAEVQTEPEILSPVQDTRSKTVTWPSTPQYNAPKSYVPKCSFQKEPVYTSLSNKNFDTDITHTLRYSMKPLTCKEILFILRQNNVRYGLYKKMTEHDINVRLYTMHTDKLVKKVFEKGSDSPIWSLP